MTYTREIRKKLKQIEVKEAEIEALENDIRVAAFNHIATLAEGDIFSSDAPHYLYLYKWRDITITLKNGKEKRLRGVFFRVFLHGKKPVLIIGNEQIDIFKIKKIEIC